MRQPDSDFQQNLAQKIAKWKAGLADLGRRNPLIKFRHDSPRSLEILTAQPEILFKHLTENKQVLYFQAESDVQAIVQPRQANITAARNSVELRTRQQGNEQLKTLKKLRSEARLSLEERGVNSLFLAFGTLTWYDKDKPDEALTSPLILVPVDLTKEPKRDVYKISILEEDVVLNPTLLLKLKQTFGIELPEGEAIQEMAYSELISQIGKLLEEQQTWKIKENVFLSLFSYAKAAMVRDIIENEARIFSHPMLQAISGNLSAYRASYKEPLPASALDSQVKPERIFQILDADSSQQVVIEAAKDGSSFFVQGPPGTGKSQTIVNMIAELIGTGKSVLLVAEKDTALRVVYQRMVECGLDHMCLNLHHSGTTDKRKLVEDLSKTIKHIEHIAQNSDKAHHDSFFAQLLSNRQSVNLYLASLHAKEKPLDKSPFELTGELLKKKREGIPDLSIIFTNVSQWTPTRLQEAKNLLNRLAGFLPFFNQEKTTIWAQSNLRSDSLRSHSLMLELSEKIEEFKYGIESIQSINQQLKEILKTQDLSNLEALEKYDLALRYLKNIPSELPSNWAETNISEVQLVLGKLKSDVQVIEQGSPYLLEVFSQEFSELCNRFQSYSDLWLLRFFDHKYKADLELIKQLFNIKGSVSHAELKHGLSQALKILNIKNKFYQPNYPAHQVFGSLFRPNVSRQIELEPIEKVVNWLTGLQQYLHLLPSNLVSSMARSTAERRRVLELISKFESAYDAIKQGLEFLLSHFTVEDVTEQYIYLDRVPFAELNDFLILL